jgi:hypothetical protein
MLDGAEKHDAKEKHSDDSDEPLHLLQDTTYAQGFTFLRERLTLLLTSFILIVQDGFFGEVELESVVDLGIDPWVL